MSSILTSIKQNLGISESDTNFDQEIIMSINAVLFTLSQIGIGGSVGFSITSKADLWTDFLEASMTLEAVKIYIYLKTRLQFDPPSSAFVLDSIDRQIKELEWRLNVKAEEDQVVEEPVLPEDFEESDNFVYENID